MGFSGIFKAAENRLQWGRDMTANYLNEERIVILKDAFELQQNQHSLQTDTLFGCFNCHRSEAERSNFI